MPQLFVRRYHEVHLHGPPDRPVRRVRAPRLLATPATARAEQPPAGPQLAVLRPLPRPHRADRRRCARPGRTTTSTPNCPGTSGTSRPTSSSRVWGWEIARREDPDRPAAAQRPRRAQARSPASSSRSSRRSASRSNSALIIGPREAVEVETLYAGQPSAGEPVLRRSGPAGGLAAASRRAAARPAVVRRRDLHLPPAERQAALRPDPADRGILRPARVPGDLSRGPPLLRPEDDVRTGADHRRFRRQRHVQHDVRPRALVIIISGHSYNAENEHLIAAANGNELHYFWGRSELDMPPNRYSLHGLPLRLHLRPAPPQARACAG